MLPVEVHQSCCKTTHTVAITGDTGKTNTRFTPLLDFCLLILSKGLNLDSYIPDRHLWLAIMALPVSRARGSEACKTTVLLWPPSGRSGFRGSLQVTRSLLCAMLLLSMLVVCNFCEFASCVSLTVRSNEDATPEQGQETATQIPAFVMAGQAPPTTGSGSSVIPWYTLRTNQPPRLLRVTALPEEKPQEGGRWYQIMFNFKPSVLKLTADSKA